MHRINFSDLKRSNVKTCTHYGQVKQAFSPKLSFISELLGWIQFKTPRLHLIQIQNSIKNRNSSEILIILRESNKSKQLIEILWHWQRSLYTLFEIYSNNSIIVGCYLSCLKYSLKYTKSIHFKKLLRCSFSKLFSCIFQEVANNYCIQMLIQER